MKILLLISSLLTVAVAQQSPLVCSYYIFFDTYRCDLTWNNPNGLNNFTEVGGIHLEGFTNADVEVIYHFNGLSTNIPRIICDQFPNLLRMVIIGAGVTEIGDTDFYSCSRLAQLELNENRISTISANAFSGISNIRYINLNLNQLTSLPENLFVGLQNLTDLSISSNIFRDLPAGLFRPLESLVYLSLELADIYAINNEWFTTNTRLNYLLLLGNRIALEPDSLAGLEALNTLDLGFNGISEIPSGAFAGVPNLQYLFLHENEFVELQADAFEDLGQLRYLDLSYNPRMRVIEDGAFRGLVNLTSLYMSYCGLRRIESNYFENLGNLNILNLNFNQIEEISQDAFAPLSNVFYIALRNNRLKTLRRNIYGTLTSLVDLDLDGNIVNALDRDIIVDAVNLSALFFSRNLCASGFFGNFYINREQYLSMLETCFSNMRYIIDTVTEGDNEFTFYEGLDIGIVLRVNTANEVQIALAPFNFVWNPVIEILIGTANNTRSVIRINEETNVVTAPTPNILQQNQWNDFRISWVNQVILVYSGNSPFPFMTYTMQDFFPVNFYGLRAVETRASWSVQPLD